EVWKERLRDYAVALALTCLATFCTPYGLDLHRHVAGLLVTSGVTGLIDEYQPMPFGKPTARIMEWVLLALVALPSLTGRRMSRSALAHGLVWLHLSLGSIRHAPLFGLAIAPAPAGLFDSALPSARREARVGRLRDWPWPAVAASVAVLMAVGLGWNP